MSFLDNAFERARQRRARIVFPEGSEPRIRTAAERLDRDGLARPVLLDPDIPPDPEPLVDAILSNRPKTKPAVAARMVRNPIFAGAAMVAAGQADALVAGAQTPTKKVIEAAGLAIGMADGTALPSSFFVMLVPGHGPLFFADCALNVAPSAADLADIALATARSAHALSGAPSRTAFLSFSTHKSGVGESVDRVAEAMTLAQDRAPGELIDGPLQADAALSGGIAAKKGVSGPVAGAANVLIFPDLDAGNIGYKMVQELARAQALGPFLQGFAKPVCDLSRGASVDDIVAAAAITAAME